MIQVLYQDLDFCVVNKPSGLPTTPTRDSSRDSVQSLMKGSCPHRLDVPTSGLLIVTHTPQANRHFSELFRERKIQKVYWALSPLNLQHPPSWKMENFLKEVRLDGRDKMVATRSGGFKALTDFRVLRTHQDFALVEARPFTGRKHQIRSHMADSYGAILGDPLYGPSDVKTGLCLHSYEMTFQDPRGKTLQLQCDPPSSWAFKA